MPNFLKLAIVRTKTTLSTGAIYAGMNDETFPASIQISPGRVAWIEDEIDAWCDEVIRRNRENVEG